MSYEYNPSFNVQLYAKARVDGAAAFRSSVTQSYRNSYEDFWCLNRTEVAAEDMQAIIAELGVVALSILTDSGTFVEAIATAFPGELEEKYFTAPYEYSIVDGQLILGALKEDWVPESPEETP